LKSHLAYGKLSKIKNPQKQQKIYNEAEYQQKHKVVQIKTTLCVHENGLPEKMKQLSKSIYIER